MVFAPPLFLGNVISPFGSEKKKTKRRAPSYRYSSQADLKTYLKAKPLDQWDGVDLINYFHLWQMILGSPIHYPMYRSESRFAKILIKTYGIEKAKQIVLAFFSNREKFETSRFKLNDSTKCTFRVLNLSSGKKTIYTCLSLIGEKDNDRTVE